MSRRAVHAHVAVLAGVFVALAAWTWGAWPDVLVDFGRELYVPWRLTEGERLYSDIAYFNGPLSPQWNALLFRVFGVGLATLVWSNLALFAAFLALLHAVLRSLSCAYSATLACVVVMCVSGFGQLVGIGNYNFVCPYSHEVTHGLVLAVAAFACAQRAARGFIWLALAGLCVGLAFLTKPETFLAAAAGSATLLALRPRALRNLAIALGVAAAAAGVAWMWIATASSSAIASQAVLGAWPSLLSSEVSKLAFYRAGMGLDAPGDNALKMLAWTLSVAALLAPSALIARWSPSRFDIVAAFVVSAAAAWALSSRFPPLQAARAWPLLVASVAVFGVLRWRRDRDDERAAGLVAFAMLALALLGKMLLNARTIHYGFALTLPATALIVVALDGLPCQLRVNATTMRAGVLALAIGFASAHLATTSKALVRKDFLLGEGADRMRTDVRGRVVDAALAWIRANVRTPNPTLAVLPEGVTINYLARLANPTPYVNFMPPELVLFGEPAMVAAFEADPPDVVLLVHKSTAEYGLPWFGRDYARELKRWIDERYRLAQLFGDPPLEPSSRFGIAVLVRR